MKRFGTLLMCLMLMLCSISHAGVNDVNDVVVDANIITVPGIAVWGQIDNTFERIIGLRAGCVTDYSLEFGGTALWQQTKDWDETPDYYGVYVVYWIDELALVEDSDGYSGIEDFMHTLVARPYALVEGLYADADDKVVGGVGGGTAFYSKQDKKQTIALTIEYITIEGYEEKLRTGLRFKF